MKFVNGRTVYSDPKVAAAVTENRKRLAKSEIKQGALGLVDAVRQAFYGLIVIVLVGLFLQLVTGNLT